MTLSTAYMSKTMKLVNCEYFCCNGFFFYCCNPVVKNKNDPHCSKCSYRKPMHEYLVTTPWACGLVVKNANDKIIDTAPIFHRWRGKQFTDMLRSEKNISFEVIKRKEVTP